MNLQTLNFMQRGKFKTMYFGGISVARTSPPQHAFSLMPILIAISAIYYVDPLGCLCPPLGPTNHLDPPVLWPRHDICIPCVNTTHH